MHRRAGPHPNPLPGGEGTPGGGWGQLAGRLLPLQPQLDEEGITFHKHWFDLVRRLIPPLALGLFGALLWVVVLSGLADRGWWAAAGLVFCMGWLWWRYEDWRNDYYRVTADRLVDVHRLPLGWRSESREAPLRNVQSLTIRVPNAVAAFFGYGDIRVETAGAEGELVFHSIGSPLNVMEEVARRADAARSQAGDSGPDLVSLVTAYDRLQRIQVLERPQTAVAGQILPIRWSMNNDGLPVDTWLGWGFESSEGGNYEFGSPMEEGRRRVRRGLLVVPLTDRLFWRIFARAGNEEFHTREFQTLVTGFDLQFPLALEAGVSTTLRWRLEGEVVESYAVVGTAEAGTRRLNARRRGPVFEVRMPPSPSGTVVVRLVAQTSAGMVASRAYRLTPAVTSVVTG